MNVLVVGLGSMGKRRIRLLKTLFNKIQICGVDFNKERRSFCEKEYNISTYSSIEDVFFDERIEVAFICTSPLSHHQIIEKCLEKKMHVFTEINLVSDGYEKNIALAKKNKVTLFLSSTPLYRKEMNYIIEKIQQCDCLVNYSYHVGQYLPDWHPWETFNDFFIGDKRTNGCREIFAIEFPWMIKAFGEIEDVQVVSSKNTQLNIDYHDNYLLLLKHKSGHKGMFAVDVVCREAVRKLEVFGENIFIEWQGTVDSLKCKNINGNIMENIKLYQKVDKIDGYSSNIIENSYLEEIKTFFSIIEGKEISRYTFAEDYQVLKIIDEIEKR